MVIVGKNGEVGEYEEYEFLNSFIEVYSEIFHVIPGIKGMNIEKVDKQSGILIIKARSTSYTIGENIEIQLTKVDKNLTRVRITSWPKMKTLMPYIRDFGKNQKNIEIIINAISESLTVK